MTEQFLSKYILANINIMTTKELLKTCYKSFAQKQGWEAVISDDFKFVGGDMTKREPVVGKQAYIDVINGSHKYFKTCG